MAWTTPPTYVTGQLMTAAIANAQWRDNENFLDTAHGARAWRASALSGIAASTGTVVPFTDEGSSGMGFDSDTFHDTSTNNSRFIIPSGLAGTYIVAVNIYWDGTVGANAGYRFANIRKNAAGNPASGTSIASVQAHAPGSGTDDTYQSLTAVLPLVVADYVEVFVRHNDSTGTVLGGSAGSWMSLLWQGA